MKLNAIANRGGRKDFWDYAELLSHFTPREMLEVYAHRYSGDNLWYVEKSLCYFDDAEADPSPRDLRGRSWDDVKMMVQKSNRL